MPESTLREPVTVVHQPLTVAPPVAQPRTSSALTLGFWPRAGIVAALTVFAYFHLFAQVVTDAVAGSRTAYLLVIPVLVALIAYSDRQPAKGVADTETDWIAVLLVGAAGFTGLHLLAERMPTTAAVWGLPAVGALLWFGCAVAALFGIRQVVRMWRLWLFALALGTPLPYLLAVAMLGGSDVAAAAVAATAGLVAVWLALRNGPRRWRLLTALGSAAASTVYLVTCAGLTPLVLDVLVCGGVFPGLAAAIGFALTSSAPGVGTDVPAYPPRSPAALAAMTVAAAALFALQPPGMPEPALPTVDAGWTGQGGLGEPTHFDFITRYLGPHSSLTRYPVTRTGDQPVAVIDVFSSPDREAIEDYADTIWYPTRRPVQYQPVEVGGSMTVSAKAAHTDASAATTSTAQDWYALTWLWHAGSEFEQVTVLVNQRPDSTQLPPAPTPPSLRSSVLAPALWIARQQAGGSGDVDPLVIQRAHDLAGSLVGSAGDAARNPIGV